MKTIQAHRQSFTAKRWLEFINSVASGLHLLIVLHSTYEEDLQLWGKCLECSGPCNAVSLDGQKELISELPQANLLSFELEDGSPAIYYAIDEMLYLVATPCSCSGLDSSLPFYERAAVACELLTNFYYCLQDGFKAGHQAVELTMLKQMNRITLSLFQGDDKAVDKAFDLLLSAAVILLEAGASRLDIVSDGTVNCYTKGDQTLALLPGDQVKSIAVNLNKGKSSGQIRVINPADQQEAYALLPLLAQECSIVLEIKQLYNLMQAQLNQWLGAIGSALLLVDQYHSIIYLNRLAEDLFGQTASELLGRSVFQLSGPWETCIISPSKFPVAEQMGMIIIGEENRWVDWQVSPLMEKDRPLGWIILINDRSDLQRWQEASRKAERFATTATLVGSLAHELRNPLSAATGLLQILSKQRDPTTVAGYSDLVLGELNRIKKLLNEFLLLGRPANISLEPLDLKQLLHDLLPLLLGEASGNGHQILLIDSDPVSLIWGDPGQLTQVILNLVRNALEAMPEAGKVLLSIGQDDKAVSISIRDYGPGMKAEALENLFQPFFTTKEQGTGLGLSVVKAIIDNHGGQIHYRNVPDGGAEFHIDLLPYQGFDGEALKIDVVLAASNRILEHALRNTGLNLIRVQSLGELESLAGRYEPEVIVIEALLYEHFILELKEMWPDTAIIVWGEINSADKHIDPQYSYSTTDYIKLMAQMESLFR